MTHFPFYKQLDAMDCGPSCLCMVAKYYRKIGTSGSGKTTLIKLMLGFYEPTRGEINLGGIGLRRFSESNWRKRYGVVMQEGYIFSDTIANNIGIIDEVPDPGKIEQAVATANI